MLAQIDTKGVAAHGLVELYFPNRMGVQSMRNT